MRWFPPHVPVGAGAPEWPGSRTSCAGTAWTCKPVHIEGRTIARSFWGRRWCHHLESCSDFENRPAAGPRVCPQRLRLSPDVHAAGSTPWSSERTSITSSCASGSSGQVAWKAIRAECAGRSDPSSSCSRGGCPITSARRHTDPDRGLFPKPGEITLTCDCPDWAVMCKHRPPCSTRRQPARRPSRAALPPAGRRRRRPGRRRHGVAGRLGGGRRPRGDLADIFGIDLDPGGQRRRGRSAEDHRTPPAPPREAASDRRPAVRVPAYGPPVAELRHQGGFSVPEFAGLLRVSASTVYRWAAARGPLALRAGQEDALQVLYLGNRETPDLSDPARSWPDHRGRRAVRPPILPPRTPALLP